MTLNVVDIANSIRVLSDFAFFKVSALCFVALRILILVQSTMSNVHRPLGAWCLTQSSIQVPILAPQAVLGGHPTLEMVFWS